MKVALACLCLGIILVVLGTIFASFSIQEAYYQKTLEESESDLISPGDHTTYTLLTEAPNALLTIHLTVSGKQGLLLSILYDRTHEQIYPETATLGEIVEPGWLHTFHKKIVLPYRGKYHIYLKNPSLSGCADYSLTYYVEELREHTTHPYLWSAMITLIAPGTLLIVIGLRKIVRTGSVRAPVCNVI